jgi:hypothetical protein
MIETLVVWAGIWATEGGCHKYCSGHQHRMNVAYYYTHEQCVEAMEWRKGLCLPVDGSFLNAVEPPKAPLKVERP